MQERFRDVSTRRVEQRVARALLRLVRQFGVRIAERLLIDIPYPMSRKSKGFLRPERLRIPLMALAGIALLAGMWGGVIRAGWQLPPLAIWLPAQHGPLMVSGFLGTLISLERAAALNQYGAGRRLF